MVSKKNGKLQICMDFRKLNNDKKNEPYFLPFTDEVLDMVLGHDVYSFLDGFSGYHQITIILKYKYKITFIIDWGTFVWIVMPFKLKNVLPIYQWAMNMAFHEYLEVFINSFLDDFNVFIDLKMHLAKLWLCFDKHQEFGISLNLKKYMFLVYSGVILGYVVFKVGKYPIWKWFQQLWICSHQNHLKT